MKKDTQNGFAYANQENFYGELPTAHIDARYWNGRFYDIENDQLVALKNKALVRLVVYRKDIPETARERFYSSQASVLKEGTILCFRLPKINLTFYVRILGDLIFEKTANKLARALDVRCEVYDRINQYGQQCLPILVADSLNQAYFQVSVRHRPKARSHAVNIYQKFYIKGTDRTLKTLRF